MNIYNQVVAYVDEAYGEKKPHFERTVYWLEKFLPDCSEAHRIAAYSHDIERAFRDESVKPPKDYLDLKFLRHHQEEGARLMKSFLEKCEAPEAMIETVTRMISRHEEGGDDEQTALMDADSVSFMETNAELFVHTKAPKEGYGPVKKKLDWMFKRISSPKAKDAARENYQKWSKELEQYK